MSIAVDLVIDEIFGLYDRFGDEEYGEYVTQLQHASQAAALAEAEGYEEEVILSALFHDIGHLYGQQLESERMETFGVVDHERLGAAYLLAKGFSNKMALLVESHVSAKRYLIARRPGYYDQLSEASQETLRHQGGPMSQTEADAFEMHPYFSLIVKMREWDDEAKYPDCVASSWDRYREMARRVLIDQSR